MCVFPYKPIIHCNMLLKGRIFFLIKMKDRIEAAITFKRILYNFLSEIYHLATIHWYTRYFSQRVMWYRQIFFMELLMITEKVSILLTLFKCYILKNYFRYFLVRELPVAFSRKSTKFDKLIIFCRKGK